MLNAFADSPALWGFLGAIIYTTPRFSACFWQCRDNRTGWTRCLFDAIISLLIGTLAAYIMAEWTQDFLKRNGAHELRAISALIGLLANRLAPKMVDSAEGLLSKKWPGTGS